MADGSRIEWTDATWTPVRARFDDGSGKERIGWHCEHVSEGCRNCYAEAINRRLGTGLEFKPGHLYREERVHSRNRQSHLFLDERMLTQPLRWRRPRMVFVCSMTDLFADFVPDEWIDKIFAVMALAPQHTFQVLTKRPARMRAYLTSSGGPLLRRLNSAVREISESRVLNWPHVGPLPNVWLGTSVEDQAAADERIPILLDTPAAVRWVSAEPLLGPLDLYGGDPDPRLGGIEAGEGLSLGIFWKADGSGPYPGIDWIVAGGESGPNARPMHPSWIRSLRDQCAAAEVAFHFKQWGEFVGGGIMHNGWAVYQNRSMSPGWDHDFGDGHVAARVGKKAAGRRLDRVEHDGMPR